MTIQKLAAVVAVSIFLTAAAYSQQTQLKLRYFGGLFMSNDTRLLTHGNAVREREEKVQELISIVKSPNVAAFEDGPLHAAISLLGVYRAKEAVDALVDRLAFLPVRTSRAITEGRRPTQFWYPSVRALVEIGDVSVGKLREKIILSNNKEERELAAWVIMQLQGKARALETLDADAKKTSNEYRKRLELTADYVKNFKPTLGPPDRYLKSWHEPDNRQDDALQSAMATTP